MKELIESELNKGVSQRSLADKITVSQGTIQKILFTTTKFTYETRKKVADYFGVPVSNFYEDSTGEVQMKKQGDDDLLLATVKNNMAQITQMQATIARLQETVQSLTDGIGREFSELKGKMDDAARTGDIKRLGMVSVKGR